MRHKCANDKPENSGIIKGLTKVSHIPLKQETVLENILKSKTRILIYRLYYHLAAIPINDRLQTNFLSVRVKELRIRVELLRIRIRTQGNNMFRFQP